MRPRYVVILSDFITNAPIVHREVIAVITTANSRAKPRTTPLQCQHFERHPQSAAWSNNGPHAFWIDKQAGFGQPCLAIAGNGVWDGPLFAVSPFKYYALRFQTRLVGGGYVAIFFYDASGRVLNADDWHSVDSSENWKSQCLCFNGGNPAAVRARIRFAGNPNPMNSGTLPVYFLIRAVEVSLLHDRRAADWADEIYAGIPKLNFTPDPGRWNRIPRTMKKLRNGEKLRIVMLGDSIVNDTGNSQWGVLLKRLYPNSALEIVRSVRGSTGCSYYCERERLQEYVLDYAPDLLLIGGVSQSQNTEESIRCVIAQVKSAFPDCEFLVLTGAVNSDGYNPFTQKNWKPEIDLNENCVRASTCRAAFAEDVEFLDLAGVWGTYILSAGQPYTWFQRDPVHANVRGKQVLGRILEAYFSPKP